MTFLKQNWFKVCIIGLFLIVTLSVSYYYIFYLPQKDSLQMPYPTPLQDQQPTPTQKSQVYPKQIEEPFGIDGVEYFVLSAIDLGSDIPPKTSGKYVEVKLLATNKSTSVVWLMNHLAYELQDSGKRRYRAVPMPYVGINGYTQLSDVSNETIKPGFTEKFAIVFEVARDSEGLLLIIGDGTDVNFYVPLGF